MDKKINIYMKFVFHYKNNCYRKNKKNNKIEKK